VDSNGRTSNGRKAGEEESHIVKDRASVILMPTAISCPHHRGTSQSDPAFAPVRGVREVPTVLARAEGIPGHGVFMCAERNTTALGLPLEGGLARDMCEAAGDTSGREGQQLYVGDPLSRSGPVSLGGKAGCGRGEVSAGVMPADSPRSATGAQ
jgi:hypothetical protein